MEIQAPEQAVGRVYNCLNQHRAQILSDEKRVGTPMFTIKAYLPVAESFGFNAQLRFQTSGQAFPAMCIRPLAGYRWMYEIPSPAFSIVPDPECSS